MSCFILFEEEFEYTKGVIRIRKSKDRQHNGQKDKQRSTKRYTNHESQCHGILTPMVY